MRFILVTICLICASTLFGSSPPKTQRILALVQSANIQTVEELLSKLPDDIFATYLPIANSRSLQRGTRILLFSKSGDLTASFNLDPEQMGYNAFEIKEFIPRKNKMVFSEIIFSADTLKMSAAAVRLNHIAHNPKLVQKNFENGAHRVSAEDGTFEANINISATCSSCHSLLLHSRFDIRQVKVKADLADDPRLLSLDTWRFISAKEVESQQAKFSAKVVAHQLKKLLRNDSYLKKQTAELLQYGEIQQLRLLLDPAAKESGFKELQVHFWPMTASSRNIYFGDTFPIYREEILNSLGQH